MEIWIFEVYVEISDVGFLYVFICFSCFRGKYWMFVNFYWQTSDQAEILQVIIHYIQGNFKAFTHSCPELEAVGYPVITLDDKRDLWPLHFEKKGIIISGRLQDYIYSQN